MCGFAGALERDIPGDRWQGRLAAMGARLVHRGPDDAGDWFDPEAGVGFAHRRLAVIDLSREGHQPMASRSGRFIIAYNGEIYNSGKAGTAPGSGPPGYQTAVLRLV
jgi:asparagine synthase (glutamine-hydrolysing)